MQHISEGKRVYFLASFLPAQRLSERGSIYLDILRALSAVLVMIGHLRGLFFVSFGNVTNPSMLVKVSYFLTSLGHEAVVVFFVLSGYFIAGSVMRGLADGSWQWRGYITRRLTRLYLVLIPALVVGGLLDLAGIKLFGSTGVYWADPDYKHIVANVVQDNLDVRTFVANALFLQSVIAPTFGSNGPLWSLSYEFWFYFMFPCAALVIATGFSLWERLLFGAVFIAISIFVGPVIFSYFFIWLLGAAVVVLPAPRMKFAGRAVSLALAVVLCMTLFALRGKISASVFESDAALAVLVAFLVYLLAGWPQPATPNGPGVARLMTISRGAAGFSYTLYLVHLPLLVFLEAMVLWNGGARWQPDMTHGAIGVGIAISVLAYAYVISRFTEAYTGELTAYFLGRRKTR